MIKLIVLIKRRPEISREEFARHWREVHAPLVVNAVEVSSHIRGYVQNHVAASSDESSADEGFDGIFEAWYENEEALAASTSSQTYMDVIRPDELRFIDHARCISYIVEEHTVIGAQIG